ncbi:MAG: T9SS type A sorting domain-containing protein [Bacteroidales bacterium]|nr:T9SS type A sorting domain-containing protein [Bacteroidales bacterium]
MVSRDNGENWEEIVLPYPATDIQKIKCIGSDTVFVSTWQAEGAFLSRSFDSGATWESGFITDNPNEYVSDIAITSAGYVFVSLNAYFNNMGGVFKSEDGGATWEYAGLLNHQVMTIETNSHDDVFTGDWWVMEDQLPGIHAIYDIGGSFESVFYSTYITDIVITSQDIIYATANESVVCSYDNGQTFEYIDDDLSSILKMLHIGSDNHLYGAKNKRLVKSLDPIITGIDDNFKANQSMSISIYPNPVDNNLHVYILSEIQVSKSYPVFIYDLFGRLIRHDLVNMLNDHFCLNVGDLSPGIYHIEIGIENKHLSSKFLKQ